MSGDVSCAVCGRTILSGERVRAYVSAEGPEAVCVLCEDGAERLGWRPEDEVIEEPVSDVPAKQRRGWGFRRRRAPDPEPAPKRVSEDDPAAAGMRSEGAREEVSPLTRFERAVARFNASDAGHTVGGLVRTLGEPLVSVGASAGTPNEVRITVAWELSWYQWGVDLADELRPVFQLDKGLEISQLDSPARQWNASVLEGGRIVMVAPASDAPSEQPAGR
jgi:hypothetical protein